MSTSNSDNNYILLTPIEGTLSRIHYLKQELASRKYILEAIRLFSERGNDLFEGLGFYLNCFEFEDSIIIFTKTVSEGRLVLIKKKNSQVSNQSQMETIYQGSPNNLHGSETQLKRFNEEYLELKTNLQKTLSKIQESLDQ